MEFNSPKTKQNSKTPKRKHGKSMKFASPDPVVSDISELITNGLSLMSPDKGLMQSLKKKLNEKLNDHSGPSDISSIWESPSARKKLNIEDDDDVEEVCVNLLILRENICMSCKFILIKGHRKSKVNQDCD